MKLNDIDLNKLRTFAHVYQALSVRGAARALHVTPAAVSMGLRALEKDLGTQLFTRSGRAMVATASADQLQNIVLPFFSDLQTTTEGWRQGRGVIRGSLVLGLPGEFGTKIVMPLMAQFREQFPQVRFKVLVREPQGLMPELVSGRLDVIICDDGVYLKRFTQVAMTAVAREDLVLACSSSFYSAKVRGEHALAHLKTLDHVAYVESQEDLQKWYKHHFHKTPRLPVSVVADNVHAVLAAVRCGLGLGLLPAATVEDDVRSRRLQVIGTKRPVLQNTMFAVRLKDRVTTAVERLFLTRLKEHVQSHGLDRATI